MGCLLLVIALMVPRLALFLVFLFTNWLGAAFGGWLLPLLGFFLMPFTTLAYAGGVHWGGGRLTLGWAVVLVLAVLADAAHWSGGYRVRKRRSRNARR